MIAAIGIGTASSSADRCRPAGGLLFLLAMLAVAIPVPAWGATDGEARILIEIPDAKRLGQHWHDSIFGATWDLPAMSGIRAEVEAGGSGIPDAIRAAARRSVAAICSVRIALMPGEGGGASGIADLLRSQGLVAQIDMGEAAEATYAAVAAQSTTIVIAGADAACQTPWDGWAMARFGTQLILAQDQRHLVPAALAPSPHDLTISIDGRALAGGLDNSGNDAAGADIGHARQGDPSRPGQGRIHLAVDLVDDGIRTAGVIDAAAPFLGVLDAEWMDHLPATVHAAGGIAIDGPAAWSTMIKAWMEQVDAAGKLPAQQTEHGWDAMLRQVGIPCGIAEAIQGLRGTIWTANSEGDPLPGFTAGIPRSAVVDRIVEVGLGRMRTIPPEEGKTSRIALPNQDMQISVLRAERYWVISSDPAVLSQWPAPQAGGWPSTPVGRLARSRVQAGTAILVVSDAVGELHTLRSYAMRGLTGTHAGEAVRSAVIACFEQAIGHASPSYQDLQRLDGRLEEESHGLLGFGSTSTGIILAAAAMAIPRFAEVRSDTAEGAAASLLKYPIFAAEVQFQAANFHDRDRDGRGDYGFFRELAAAHVTGLPNGPLHALLAEQWASSQPFVQGYRFCIYLPDGTGGALAAEEDHDLPRRTAMPGPSDAFIAYAWPSDAAQGKHVFAITQRGTIYVHEQSRLPGTAPSWNDLFDHKGWADPPAWQPYRQGHE